VDTQPCAKDASKIFCAPTSQSVRTAGSQLCSAVQSDVVANEDTFAHHVRPWALPFYRPEARVRKTRRRRQRCNKSATRRSNCWMCAVSASNAVCSSVYPHTARADRRRASDASECLSLAQAAIFRPVMIQMMRPCTALSEACLLW